MIGRVVSAGNGRLVIECDADEQAVCALAFAPVHVGALESGPISDEEREKAIARIAWLAAGASNEALRATLAFCEAAMPEQK